MIPSLVQQITAACMPRTAEHSSRSSPRRARRENILMMMLGRNVFAADLARHYKKSLTMVQEDMQSLAESGYAVSFMSEDGRYKRRMWSLTKSGIQRAKTLKEMSE